MHNFYGDHHCYLIAISTLFVVFICVLQKRVALCHSKRYEHEKWFFISLISHVINYLSFVSKSQNTQLHTQVCIRKFSGSAKDYLHISRSKSFKPPSRCKCWIERFFLSLTLAYLTNQPLNSGARFLMHSSITVKYRWHFQIS